MQTIFNFFSFDIKNKLIQFPKIYVDYELLMEYLTNKNITTEVTNRLPDAYAMEDMSFYLINKYYSKFKHITIIFCRENFIDKYWLSLSEVDRNELKTDTYIFIIIGLMPIDLLHILNKIENLKTFW